LSNQLKQFKIISKGEIAKDWTIEQVLSRVQQQFKINETQAKKVLTTGFVIKKNIDEVNAKKICGHLLKLGLITDIHTTSDITRKTTHTRQSINRAELEKIFNNDIPRAPVKFYYRLGLISVALLSLLAPIIYFGLIISLTYGIYSYLIYLPELISKISSGILILIVSIIPPFVIGILILFLCKPFFTRKHHWRGFQLKQKQAPALFSVVEIMCNRIDIPVPNSIFIDNEVNASAGSANGLVSLIRGELKLTIGLPLISGMNARQFVGIIAHEFGHFAQPSAMFTYYLISTVNHWFADRAYNRDSWDDRLNDWGNRGENYGWVYIAVLLAKLGIGSTRLVFRGLYLINLRVTRFMSRQMEYDVDRYEALISGSDHFKETAIKLRILSEAEHLVHYNNMIAWDQNKLIQNIPDAIATQSDQLDKDTLHHIKTSMQKEDCNWWDSHPPDNNRVEHAQAHQYDALFKEDFPAELFFNHFEELCNNVTLFNYRANGIEAPEQYITNNEQILKLKESQDKTNKALDSYFNDSFTSFRFMKLTKTTNNELAILDIQKTVDWLRQNLIQYQQVQELFYNQNSRYQIMLLGINYVKSDIKINPSEFYFTNSDPTSFDNAKNEELKNLFKTNQQHEQVDALFYQRLSLAISTMQLEQQQQCQLLLTTLTDFSKLSDSIQRLTYTQFSLENLLQYKDEQNDNSDKLKSTITEQSRFCSHYISLLLESSKNIRDLIDGSPDKNLTHFIFSYTGRLPNDLTTLESEPLKLIDIYQKSLNAVRYQYVWLFGELVTMCEAHEQGLNIKPIKLLNLASK